MSRTAEPLDAMSEEGLRSLEEWTDFLVRVVYPWQQTDPEWLLCGDRDALLPLIRVSPIGTVFHLSDVEDWQWPTEPLVFWNLQSKKPKDWSDLRARACAPSDPQFRADLQSLEGRYPVLVEAHFWRTGCSNDWYLCGSHSALLLLLARLPDLLMNVVSVHELKLREQKTELALVHA